MHMLAYCYAFEPECCSLACIDRLSFWFVTVVFAYFYTSDTELAHWTAKIKEPIWKMLAALTVDIVTFMTVWT